MIEYAEIERRRVEKVYRRTVCDLCGAVTTKHWKEDEYDSVTPVVSLTTGHNWPGGGSGETVEVDLCPTCFTTRLLAWLKTQGVEPRVTGWDT